jgi:2-dehydro-3-deoxygluconokinase
LLAGADVAGRLRTAATMGAIACTVRGDWDGLPTRAELTAKPHPDRVVR